MRPARPSRQHPLRAGKRAPAAPSRPRRRSSPNAGSGIRFFKTLVGVTLLPACWLVTQTFFESFSRAATAGRFWASEEFWFFSLGALLWLIAFAGLPRPVVLYVFGHEATHALWVWACGGRVSGFRVGRDGGYVIADRVNAGISLAPYFFPLYSLLVLGVWGVLTLLGVNAWDYQCQVAGFPLWPGRWLGFALVGATWAFHFSFTCWMIPKDQPDLQAHGTFFSLVVIYLANVLVLAALFIVACPGVTWAGFGAELWRNALAAWARATVAAGLA